MQCPNRECGVTLDEGAQVCPQCGGDLGTSTPHGPGKSDNPGTDALVQAFCNGSIGKLANWSLILGILACVLPWAGAAALTAWGLKAEWRLPFVGTLVPVSYAPFEAVKIVSVLIALAAIAMGHLAVSMGGGRRWPLAAAVVLYPVAGLFILLLGPVVRGLSQFIPFYQVYVIMGAVAAPIAFVPVHLVSTRVGGTHRSWVVDCVLAGLLLLCLGVIARVFLLQFWFWEILGFFAVLCAPAAIVAMYFAAKFRHVGKSGGVVWRPALGALLGYFNIVLIVLVIMFTLGKGGTNLDMGACAGNLRHMDTALEKYTTANRGAFPPLSPKPGVLMFPADALGPAADFAPFLTCPTIRYAKKPTTGAASPFDDQSYFYLGYALRNDDAVEAFAKAYRKQLADGGTFDKDLVVEDAKGTHTIHRLAADSREVLRASQDPLSLSPYEGQSPGHQTQCVTDDMPILIERDIRHKNIDFLEAPTFDGAWVLFLRDGPQFIERGTWPITEKTQRILAELAE